MEVPPDVVVIAATMQGTILVAWALYLGHDGALLASWLGILGAAWGYYWHKYKVPPPSQPS